MRRSTLSSGPGREAPQGRGHHHQPLTDPVSRDDAGELETALAFLRFARHCLLKRVDGLDEEQLRRRLVASDTTLLGLVQHCAAGERWWFAHHLGGVPAYAAIDFSMVVPLGRGSAAEVIADYRAAIEESDRHIAAAGSPESLTALAVDGVHKRCVGSWRTKPVT